MSGKNIVTKKKFLQTECLNNWREWMRNPERIKKLLDQLEFYWDQNPDLRLGQIIYNIAYNEGVEVFAIEDSILFNGIIKKIRDDYFSNEEVKMDIDERGHEIKQGEFIWTDLQKNTNDS